MDSPCGSKSTKMATTSKLSLIRDAVARSGYPFPYQNKRNHLHLEYSDENYGTALKVQRYDFFDQRLKDGILFDHQSNGTPPCITKAHALNEVIAGNLNGTP